MSFDSNSSSHSGNAASLYDCSPVVQAYHFTKEPSPSIDKTRHVLRLLGRAWASPTLVGLHCGSVFTCLRPTMQKCAYVLAAIYLNFEISVFKYFMKIDLVHEGMLWGLLSWAARVQRHQPGAKTTKVKKYTYQLLVCVSTDHQWQATHRQYKYAQWLRSLQVEPVTHGMHKRHSNTRNPAYDFIIKLGPCMCSYISCPGWRNG